MIETKKKTQHLRWHKFLPFIPILGMPLTIIYHLKFGDTGIEDNTISWIFAFIQAISIVGPIIYIEVIYFS